jgi:hypothetical protein
MLSRHIRMRRRTNDLCARLITMNALYAFHPRTTATIDIFIDIIGRHFREPKSGLGFDSSPIAHMWRSIIWPKQHSLTGSRRWRPHHTAGFLTARLRGDIC